MKSHLLVSVLQILSALSFVIIGDSFNYLGIDKVYGKITYVLYITTHP